jgi:prepilin-type N-terminal cleavage/methylation domain-containing protein
MRRKIRGFTLVELMLIVAIISILAAVAIPRFSEMLIRAKEASVKAQLGALRSAFSIYYSDNEGTNPPARGDQDLSPVLVPKYIKEIPRISIPTISESIHNKSNGVLFADTESDASWAPGRDMAWFARTWADPTGTLYMTGHIGVNCTHPDSKGRTWSTW